MAERFVVPLKPGNAGGGKGPQFKTDARRSEGPGDWATSHGELWVKSLFIRACVKLRGQLRYPRSEPDCMTRPVSEHDQPHIRSPLETAVPTSRSHGELWVKSLFIRACVKLRGQFRYPRSEPDCMTRPVSEHDQPHIRSPLETAAPTSRLRRAGAQGSETILSIGISGHGFHRFVHPDPPELIRSWKI